MRFLREWVRVWIAVLAGLLAPREGAGGPPGVSEATRLEPAPSAATTELREEFFVLELAAEEADGEDPLIATPRELFRGGEGATLVGFAVIRRWQSGATRQAEWDVRFLECGTRVLQVEQTEAGHRGLIWRELRPTDGRTLHLEREEGSASLTLREWAGRRLVRAELEAPTGARLPLELLDELRDATAGWGRLALFDPLTRGFEQLELRVENLGPSPVPSDAPLRRAELVREDATLAGRYLFQGPELVAFQWQAGGLRGRRVEREDFERRRANLDPPQGAQ